MFSADQLSRLMKELGVAEKKPEKKVKPKQAEPNYSPQDNVEDILKANFIKEDN